MNFLSGEYHALGAASERCMKGDHIPSDFLSGDSIYQSLIVLLWLIQGISRANIVNADRKCKCADSYQKEILKHLKKWPKTDILQMNHRLLHHRRYSPLVRALN